MSGEEFIDHASTYEAMRAILREIGVIAKSRRTSGSGDFAFAFRGIEELLEVANPLCKKHGMLTPPVTVGQPIIDTYQGKNATMRRTLVSVEIHFRATADPTDIIVGGPFWGEASDSSDKGATKAASVAWREIMFKTFNVPTRGEDYDTEAGDQDEKKALSEAELQEQGRQRAEADASERGWNSLEDLEEAWATVKAACAGKTPAAEWARAYAKGKTASKITPGFVQELDEVLSHAKQDGDWKANYEPPEVGA